MKPDFFGREGTIMTQGIRCISCGGDTGIFVRCAFGFVCEHCHNEDRQRTEQALDYASGLERGLGR